MDAGGAPEDEFADEPSAQMAGMNHDAGMQHGGMTGMPMDGGMHMGDGGMGHIHADGGHDEMGDALCTDAFPRFSPEPLKVGNLTVKVVSVTPRPPRQRVSNDWEVEITDQTGAPLVGKLENADSWMSVHQHGGRRRPVVSALAAPGHFLLDNIDFSMRGPWEVRFEVVPQGGTPARVSLKVCVE